MACCQGQAGTRFEQGLSGVFEFLYSTHRHSWSVNQTKDEYPEHSYVCKGKDFIHNWYVVHRSSVNSILRDKQETDCCKTNINKNEKQGYVSGVMSVLVWRRKIENALPVSIFVPCVANIQEFGIAGTMGCGAQRFPYIYVLHLQSSSMRLPLQVQLPIFDSSSSSSLLATSFFVQFLSIISSHRGHNYSTGDCVHFQKSSSLSLKQSFFLFFKVISGPNRSLKIGHRIHCHFDCW